MSEQVGQVVTEIHRLQEGWTSGRDEERIADLFCAVDGLELTELKNAINRRDDHHDLEALVFEDIDDEGVRARILEHVASTAQPLGRVGVKVLSDIDDTVFPMLHETRYPRGHTTVPGVLAFLQALDDGPKDNPLSRGDLTFVTARPEVAFGLVEESSKDALAKAGITTPALLSGGLLALRSKDAMADGKLGNIARYRELFPEYGIVFVGDSGQGDVIVGQHVRETYPQDCPAVFIHDVVATPEEERARLRDLGIHVVDTYVGAATVAHGLGLISHEGAARVAWESREALTEIPWESSEQEQAAKALLERDIAAGSVPG